MCTAVSVLPVLQIGTPQYMPPEMHQGLEYSYAADVWSLGCLVYELCALEPLFGDRDEEAVARKVSTLLTASVLCGACALEPLFWDWDEWAGAQRRGMWIHLLHVKMGLPVLFWRRLHDETVWCFLRHCLVAGCHPTQISLSPPPPPPRLSLQVLATALPPALPSKYSPELQIVVNRMLQQDPSGRPSVTTLLQLPQLQSRVHLLPDTLEEQVSMGSISLDCLEVSACVLCGVCVSRGVQVVAR